MVLLSLYWVKIFQYSTSSTLPILSNCPFFFIYSLEVHNLQCCWFGNSIFPRDYITNNKILHTEDTESLDRCRQTWKNELHELRRDNVFTGFSSKFVKFSKKIGSMNVEIRNKFKNNIFIACKLSKICNYYVISLVLSFNTCQK